MSVSAYDSILFFCGSFNYVNGIQTTNVAQWICNMPVGIHEKGSADDVDFVLNNPYPNPFSTSLNIPFVLNKAADLELSVYSLQGKKVATLFNGHHAAGEYSAIWNGRDDGGNDLNKGSYIVKLDMNGKANLWSIVVLE